MHGHDADCLARAIWDGLGISPVVVAQEKVKVMSECQSTPCLASVGLAGEWLDSNDEEILWAVVVSLRMQTLRLWRT